MFSSYNTRRWSNKTARESPTVATHTVSWPQGKSCDLHHWRLGDPIQCWVGWKGIELTTWHQLRYVTMQSFTNYRYFLIRYFVWFFATNQHPSEALYHHNLQSQKINLTNLPKFTTKPLWVSSSISNFDRTFTQLSRRISMLCFFS